MKGDKFTNRVTYHYVKNLLENMFFDLQLVQKWNFFQKLNIDHYQVNMEFCEMHLEWLSFCLNWLPYWV